jgi:hypothetical protein
LRERNGEDVPSSETSVAERGLEELPEIWLDDPDGLGPKVNASDLDAEGHKLCDMNK